LLVIIKIKKVTNINNNINSKLPSTSGNIVTPVKSYANARLFKQTILSESRNQSGIYRWVNNINKKSYVGSGVNLANRSGSYYRLSVLKKEKRRIHHALLKYGHDKFTLDILEYCPKTELIVREQHYMDLLNPEYNVLKFAYSSLGYKHSANTIALLKNKITPELFKKLKEKKISPEHKKILSLIHRGKVVSPITRKKLSVATAEFKKNNPLSTLALAKIRIKTLEREGVAVSVFNTQTNEIKEFTNQTEAGEYLGVTRQAVYNAIKRGKRISGIYIITKKLV